MSRAFVREDDLESRGEFEGLERPLPPRPILITAAGRARLEAQLAETEAEEAALAEDTALAADSARQHLQREKRWLESLLAAAHTPAPEGGDEVAFGAWVAVEDAEGQEQRYRLVGEVEADPKAGDISWRSPLGRALMQSRKGDLVTWQRPAGDIELEVLAVEWD
ncbi:GreA/GreB family elongation factor [Aquibaculum sediminis]|uniref:GreA/GreB family elongation factor n=1 Tax=Aquibaculum sediminis TaxID=3231907 RepID=UPI003452DD96